MKFNEQLSNPKEEAQKIYKKFLDSGVKNPDDLDLDDPNVAKANQFFFAWCKVQDTKAAGDPIKQAEADFAKTTFYTDMGFTDSSYVRQVIGFLEQDLHNAQEGGSSFQELAAKIQEKIVELEKFEV